MCLRVSSLTALAVNFFKTVPQKRGALPALNKPAGIVPVVPPLPVLLAIRSSLPPLPDLFILLLLNTGTVLPKHPLPCGDMEVRRPFEQTLNAYPICPYLNFPPRQEPAPGATSAVTDISSFSPACLGDQIYPSTSTRVRSRLCWGTAAPGRRR